MEPTMKIARAALDILGDGGADARAKKHFRRFVQDPTAANRDAALRVLAELPDNMATEIRSTAVL